MQFARVSHATDFLYCYSIIESNRRTEYLSSSSSMSRNNSSNSLLSAATMGQSMHSELNTFFPFDPYRLPGPARISRASTESGHLSPLTKMTTTKKMKTRRTAKAETLLRLMQMPMCRGLYPSNMETMWTATALAYRSAG